MTDERAAYSDSSCRSEQLSSTKFFHPSYNYFILIFKVLNHFLNYFNSKIIIKLLGVPSPVYTKMYPGADMWAKGTQLTSQSLTGQQGWGLLVILCFLT